MHRHHDVGRQPRSRHSGAAHPLQFVAAAVGTIAPTNSLPEWIREEPQPGFVASTPALGGVD